MDKSLTVRRLGFPGFPAAHLPFYPRSCGVNCFYGQREEQEPWNIVEICWVERGVCIFEIGDSVFPVQENQSVYRMPGEKRIKIPAPDRETVIYWATFDGPRAADFMLSYGYPRRALNSGKCPVHLFDEIRNSLNSLLPSDLRRMVTLYTELIGLMGEEQNPGNRKGQLFRNALGVIHAHYQDAGLNVNSLAEILGMHRTTLDRLFLREIGVSPNRYLVKIRLHHALSLLSSTALSVSEIAVRTGFTRENYFGRVFREATGRSPLEYRRLRTGGI